MDPSRDPRKRRPSRSPDGSAARKQFKNGDSGQASPGSSLVEGPGKAATSNARNYKPPTQSDNSLFVDSPIPTTSLDDDTSGRSTPQSKSNGVSHATNTPSNPVMELLTNFTTQVAQQAALQVARDQANARVLQAKTEYDLNRPKFQEFPAIAEAKSIQRKAAQKDLDAKDERLNKHLASQAKIVDALAQMISQNQPRTDQVSREQFDGLSTKFRDVQRELYEATSKINDLSTRLAGVGQSAETTTRKQLDSFKEKEFQKFAMKEPLKQLESQYTKLSKDLSEAKASVTQVQSLAEQGPDLAKKVDELQQKTNDNGKSLEQLIASSNVQKDTTTAAPQDLIQKVDNLHQQLEHNLKSVQQIKNEVHEEGQNQTLLKRVQDFDTRFDNLVSDVRALQPEGKPSIQQRLSQLDRDLVSIQTDVKRLSQGVQPQASLKAVSSNSVDLPPVAAQVDQLRTEFNRQLSIIESNIEDTTTIVTEFVKDRIGPLSQGFENLRQDLEEAKAARAYLDAVQKSQTDLHTQINSALTVKDFVAFRDDLAKNRKGIRERVEKLEASSQQGSTSLLAQNGSTQANGVQPNLHQPLNGVSALQNQFNALSNQYAQLANITRQLKQRFDNLQTDDLARQMLDQMEHAYPHAKNFEKAVQDFNDKHRAVSSRLDTLQSSKHEMMKQVVQVATDVNNLRQDVDQKIVYAKNEISKETAPKLSTIKSEMTVTLHNHSERLDGHDQMCRIGEQKLTDLENEKDAIRKRIAEYEAKVDRLSKRYG